MQYIELYLHDVYFIKALKPVTWDDFDCDSVQVFINDKRTGIIITRHDYINWLEHMVETKDYRLWK